MGVHVQEHKANLADIQFTQSEFYMVDNEVLLLTTKDNSYTRGFKKMIHHSDLGCNINVF